MTENFLSELTGGRRRLGAAFVLAPAIASPVLAAGAAAGET